MDELLNTAPCGFLSFDDDSRILQINETLLQLLGLRRDDVKSVNDLLDGGGRIFYQTHIFPMLKLHARIAEIYLPLRAASGTEIPVLLNAARRLRDGAYVHDCCIFPMLRRNLYEDEILRGKRQAEEAARIKQEFLASVTHDLRTPLSAIINWVHVLKNSTIDEHTRKRGLNIIERSAKSQSRLIEDILDFSRVSFGKFVLKQELSDPATIIEAALEVVRSIADEKGVRLRSHVDPNAGKLFVDPERMQQVLWNLLSNAIKFSSAGQAVELRAQQEHDRLEIHVSDQGQGIAPEFLPFVFEYMRQAGTGTHARGSGLGLGLAISRHIVEQHGGRITAASEGLGRGASFVISLPTQVTEEPSNSSASVGSADRADSTG